MTGDDVRPDADIREARSAALNYLARREHSCQELETKLQRRGVDANTASLVTQELRDENLVSDARYAEAYVRSRVNRLYGPVRIRAELRKRGVADSILEEALYPYEEEWQRLADDWAKKRLKPVLDRKEQARIYRSGTNRGFRHEHMMRAIDRLKSTS